MRVARNREPGATLDQIAATDEGRLPQLPVRSMSPLSRAAAAARPPDGPWAARTTGQTVIKLYDEACGGLRVVGTAGTPA